MSEAAVAQPAVPTMLDVALAHAREGWAVFPLDGKVPCKGTHGHLDATRDEATIRRWWTQRPTANVGGATGAVSDVFVIDQDGPAGAQAFDALMHGQPVETRAVLSGRVEGGRHLYFRHPGGKVTSRTLVKGLDVKGDGGYVVLAGSVHPSGARYRVERDVSIADAPTAVLALVRATPSPEPTPEVTGWLAELIARPIKVGEANNRLTQIVGKLARVVALSGGDLAMLLALARNINARCVERPDDGVWLDDVCRRLWEKEVTKGTVATKDPSATYRLLDWQALDELKPPEWLVADVVPTDAFVLLWGLWGAGKTFLALDLALSVATGQPWHGKPLRQGPVIYVAGEGVRGLNQRRRAWATKHHDDAPIADFHVLPHALPMLDAGQVSAFADQIEAVASRAPAMIVIDTLARNTPGADENAQQDMNQFVGNLDLLRERFPDAVLLVLHHPSKAGVAPRGSTVLEGAADATLKLEVDDTGVRTLHCGKMKDGAEFADLFFRLEEVAPSCVLMPADAPVGVTPLTALSTKLGKQAMAALRTEGPATYTDWFAASGITSKATFDRYRERLVKEGLVIKAGDLYRVATTGEREDAKDEVENAPY